MAVNLFSWIAVGLIVATSTIILINHDWRMNLGALAAQYVAAFWLETRHLPFVMGSAKLITGWMVVAVLGMTCLGLSRVEEEKEDVFQSRGQWFRVILICILALVAAGSSIQIEAAIPGIGLQVIAGSLILIGAGIVHLGLTSVTLRVILGLLSMLMGFEIIYGAVESSILVTGLLALTNLGLGVVGSYLLIAGSSTPIIEEET